MKQILQRIANSFGYSVHRNGTFAELARKLENADQEIRARDARLEDAAREIQLRDAKINDLESAVRQFSPQIDTTYVIRDEFQKAAQFSNAALQKLIDDYVFETVLDIGAGALEHSEIFAKYGKKVTAVDFGVSFYHQKRRTSAGDEIDLVIGDFNKIDFDQKFECVWASHILEHQPNAAQFLDKVLSLVNEGGILAVTVPFLKHEIVGGHVSLWNAGLILYRLVLAGIDCSDASILSYGYNISVIVRKNSIGPIEGIEYDRGDLRRMLKYLPAGLRFNSNEVDDPFDGNITRLNW